jgi:hypothetical protein
MSGAVFLDELAAGLARRATPLSAESAIFIVLEAMEALGARAMVLSPSAVCIGTDGVVSISGSLDFAHDETSVLEGAIETLEAVLDPAPITVTELAIKVRGGQITTRATLLSELAALLVPLNRGAARRMAGRLTRDYARPAQRNALSSVQVSAATSTDPGDDHVLVEALTRMVEAQTASAGTASDTVIDGPVRAHMGIETDDPNDLWAEGRAARRSAQERRNAWLAVAVAACALVAAVVFLMHRMHNAGA